MKILLINPNWGGKVSQKGKRYNRSFPPIDLLVIGAILREKGDIPYLYDANVYYDKKEIKTLCENSDLVIITSTPYYKWQCPNLNYEDFLEFCKILPKEKTIIYGGHITQYPDFFMTETGFRYGIVGEPEDNISDLVEEIKNNSINFNEKNYYIKKSEKDVDIENLPIPAFDLTLKYKKYYEYEILGKNLMTLEASRGCPFKCIYCYQGMFGKRVRKKSVSKIFNEMLEAIKFGYKNFYIYDLEFTIHKDLVKSLCKKIIEEKLKINWCCQGRADSLDEDMVKLMKKSGCKIIHFGVESGSDKILDSIKKKTTKEELKRGFNLTKKYNIETAGFFMFGLPEEIEENWKETIKFAKELNPDYASFHISSLYPDTELYQKYLQSGGNKDILYPECFDTIHNKERLEKIVRKAFLQYYFRLGYILKRIIKGNPLKWWKQFKLFLSFLK
ncbi:MAG TPA: radical SAM protein [Spirochaetota bacterium]|nr:radical SAM protein [Spirochaetota bacterium]HPP03457.1 radical SAM protein [Spirochaetota bacterium]